jgi:hypothetical protein
MLSILKLLQLHEVSFLYYHVIIFLKMFQVHHYEKVNFVDFQFKDCPYGGGGPTLLDGKGGGGPTLLDGKEG